MPDTNKKPAETPVKAVEPKTRVKATITDKKEKAKAARSKVVAKIAVMASAHLTNQCDIFSPAEQQEVSKRVSNLFSGIGTGAASTANDTKAVKVLSKRDKAIARIAIMARQHLTSQCGIYGKDIDTVSERIDSLFESVKDDTGKYLIDLRPITS